jgi:hypothetical protein
MLWTALSVFIDMKDYTVFYECLKSHETFYNGICGGFVETER